MQRFTLIHDGSEQSWQAAYLAFHIAARLGAPLLVLLVDSATGNSPPAQKANQVEVGGRAAGVTIEARLVAGFSVDAVTKNMATVDGLFVPHHLVPAEEAVQQLLQALACPIWVVFSEPKANELAMLVHDLLADDGLIHYANFLSRHLRQPLAGIIKQNEIPLVLEEDSAPTWIPLPNFSVSSITSTIKQIKPGLLIVPSSSVSLIKALQINYIVCPPAWHA